MTGEVVGAPAGRVFAEGCGPFRRGDDPACATGRGQGPGERAGRFGVLVLDHLGVGWSITCNDAKVRALISIDEDVGPHRLSPGRRGNKWGKRSWGKKRSQKRRPACSVPKPSYRLAASSPTWT